uniref:Uncharacterized protein n=1 Tax=viral metagenome TaxID=1070528 RepID=A0A6C0DLG0_9ZZZZ
MKIEVSVGEAIDKLSILELKLIKIPDENKKREIQKEINVLNECQEYKQKYDFYYNLLMYVNERIWDMTDVIKSINIEDPNFASISNNIFEFNQKRFRIKNWFNLLCESNIKEQKSYASNCCNIVVENENTFFNKLPEINYLSLEYDVITFESPITNIIQDFLKIPTIIYETEIKEHFYDKTIVVNLTDFVIPNNEKTEIYSFTPIPVTYLAGGGLPPSLPPITYLAGGRLGDFINSLSVINEKFYETGRKGVVYLSDRGDHFSNGLVNTYNDIYPIIINQPYIQDFKIFEHDNEPIDIGLSCWRNSSLLNHQNWYYIYKQTYNVKWGKRQWLNCSIEDEWKNKIVINTTSYRWPSNFNFNLLRDFYSDDELLFIAASKHEHNFFETKTNIKINYHEFKSFSELCTIINSCKLFIGGLSAPLSIAHSLHKNRICCLFDECVGDANMAKNLDQFIPQLRYSL